MLKRVLVVMCILVCSSLAEAQGCSNLESTHPAFKWARNQPLVLLTEYNPWAMVIGSDSPSFALYADGTVIYWAGERPSGRYMTATLSPYEISELLKAARLDKPEEFGPCYSIADGTDAPTNVLVVKAEAGYRTIDVYGAIRDSANIPPSRMPADLQEAFHVLLAFSAPNAQEWKPPYIEVMLWPFSYAKSSASWPTTFPGVNDKNTRRSAHGLVLFLPFSDLDQYRDFVSRLKPTEAVRLDGKKWAISARIPFPHEGKP